jgi:hypothetical protein
MTGVHRGGGVNDWLEQHWWVCLAALILLVILLCVLYPMTMLVLCVTGVKTDCIVF